MSARTTDVLEDIAVTARGARESLHEAREALDSLLSTVSYALFGDDANPPDTSREGRERNWARICEEAVRVTGGFSDDGNNHALHAVGVRLSQMVELAHDVMRDRTTAEAPAPEASSR